MEKILNTIQKIPEGYSEGKYKNQKYGVTKKSFNDNRSYKIYAKALGGNDFVSLNYYCTSSAGVLKPCEMPEEKVIDFLNHLELE
ncbi:MAG: hypothetical protein Mars2KO_09580 [Maribacter sp.]